MIDMAGKLRYALLNGRWRCVGYRAIGYGKTQEEAYENWRENRRFMNEQAARARDNKRA